MEKYPAGDPRQTLDEVTGLRRRTRRARQAFWFPPLVFAALVLASAPLYGSNPHSGGGPFARLADGGGDWAATFWLVGVPLGYAAIAGYYLLRARRRGVTTFWRLSVCTGLALFAAVALLLSRLAPGLQYDVLQAVPGDLVVRGLLPLLVIAVGFGVLAATERSLEFALFAAAFFALALTANLYDLQNVTERLGLNDPYAHPYVNNLVAGGALLAGAGYFALRSRDRSRRVA